MLLPTIYRLIIKLAREAGIQMATKLVQHGESEQYHEHEVKKVTGVKNYVLEFIHPWLSSTKTPA